MSNIDQSNGEKAFRIFPTSVDTTLLIGWLYHGRITNNGTAAIAQAIATGKPDLKDTSPHDHTRTKINLRPGGDIFHTQLS